MKASSQSTFFFALLPFFALSAPTTRPCTVTGPKCPTGLTCIPNPEIHCAENSPCPGTCTPQPPPAADAGKVTFNPFSITKRTADSDVVAENEVHALEARKIVFNPFSINRESSDDGEGTELKRGKNQSMEKEKRGNTKWADIELVDDGGREVEKRGNTKWGDIELVDDAGK